MFLNTRAHRAENMCPKNGSVDRCLRSGLHAYMQVSLHAMGFRMKKLASPRLLEALPQRIPSSCHVGSKLASVQHAKRPKTIMLPL